MYVYVCMYCMYVCLGAGKWSVRHPVGVGYEPLCDGLPQLQPEVLGPVFDHLPHLLLRQQRWRLRRCRALFTCTLYIFGIYTVCMYVCIYVCMYGRLLCLSTCMYIWLYLWIFINMCMYVWMCVCVCMYVWSPFGLIFRYHLARPAC